jgi:iron complex transport system permease protein
VGLLALLALALAAGLSLGVAGIDMDMIVALRAPRVAAAAGVGALLALAGLALQVLLRNPLADPYVLGGSGGASVGGLLALMAGASLWVGAALGALAAGVALLALTRSALAGTDDASPRLVLTGAMLAALCGAISTLLLAITPDQQLRGAVFWLVGDLSGARGGRLRCAAVAAGWPAHRGGPALLGSEVAAAGRAGAACAMPAVAAAGHRHGRGLAGAIGFVGWWCPGAARWARSRDLA